MSSASVHVDHHYEADNQLQQSLESAACSSTYVNPPRYYSRKHRRTTSSVSVESEYQSEVSGQFDDADEFDSPLPKPLSINAATPSNNCSPSSYSVKRRRSNDWPHQTTGDDDATSRRETGSSRRHRWHFHHYGRHSNSAHGSPRSLRHARPARRSRFVEGHMNDSVSEKPPSIFLRDEARTESAGNGSNSNRPSGIFRFGKAIASAFGPFTGWGNMSDIWKGSPDGSQAQGATSDPLAQAERAYEELKRSGYKGTIKGSYMQSLRTTDGNLPDQTWRSIQEKMDYNGGGYHSRQSSSQGGQELVSSLRSPFPDLRKAKSSLGIPSIKRSGGEGVSSLLHPDDRGQEVRHQKSRKELQRQAKLLKRVSDLEDKLERARRELRELTGDDELSMGIAYSEKPYPKKFVPGALPSLPSERLLHRQQHIPVTEPTAPGGPPLESVICQSQENYKGKRRVTPKPRREISGSSVRDSSSRKRKSPDPEFGDPKNPPSAEEQLQKLEQEESKQQEPLSNPHGHKADTLTAPTLVETPANETTNTTEQPNTRKAKFPKNARGDSPGSVERKQMQKANPGGENGCSPADDKPPQSAQRPLRSTNLRNRSATPGLRVKKGRIDLRSTSDTVIGSPIAPTDPGLDENKENQDDLDCGTMNEQNQGRSDHSFDGDQTTPSPTPTRRKAKYEYIPPVPPLPKNLAMTAAKVDRRLAREVGKRQVKTTVKRQTSESFQWPEDIF